MSMQSVCLCGCHVAQLTVGMWLILSVWGSFMSTENFRRAMLWTSLKFPMSGDWAIFLLCLLWRATPWWCLFFIVAVLFLIREYKNALGVITLRGNITATGKLRPQSGRLHPLATACTQRAEVTVYCIRIFLVAIYVLRWNSQNNCHTICLHHTCIRCLLVNEAIHTSRRVSCSCLSLWQYDQHFVLSLAVVVQCSLLCTIQVTAFILFSGAVRANKKIAGATAADVENVIKSWLRHANDRCKAAEDKWTPDKASSAMKEGERQWVYSAVLCSGQFDGVLFCCYPPAHLWLDVTPPRVRVSLSSILHHCNLHYSTNSYTWWFIERIQNWNVYV